MDDTDAELFDDFIEQHWGKESVFNTQKYKEEQKAKASKRRKVATKGKLATEQ